MDIAASYYQMVAVAIWFQLVIEIPGIEAFIFLKYVEDVVVFKR